jgi:outer membrane protein
MKNSVLLLLLSFSVAVQAQNSTTAFSLKQAIDYALQNGYSVKNAATDIEIAKKKITEVRGIGIPQVKAEASFQDYLKVPVSVIQADAFNPLAPPNSYLRIPFGVQYNASYGYTASWLAFSGEYIVGLQASKAYLDVSKSSLRKSEIEVKESVTRAYNTVLILKENKKILDENIASLDQSIEQTEAFYKEGFVEEMDVDRLKLLRNNLANTLQNLVKQTDLAERLLKFQMGYEVESPISLSDELKSLLDIASTEIGESTKFNIEGNIDALIIDQSITLQKLDLKRQKANYLPTLSTFYTWKESRIASNFDQLSDNMFRVSGGTIFGVNLGMPIFQGFSQSAKVKQAKLNLQKLEVSKTQATQGLSLQASQSLIGFTNAVSTLKYSRENVQLAERIRDRARIKYKEGVGSSIEVIQAENDLLNAQSTYINAVQQVLDSRVTLDKNLNKF